MDEATNKMTPETKAIVALRDEIVACFTVIGDGELGCDIDRIYELLANRTLHAQLQAAREALRDMLDTTERWNAGRFNGDVDDFRAARKKAQACLTGLPTPAPASRWTDRPAKEGWYWWFDEDDFDEPAVVEVFPDADDGLYFMMGDVQVAIKDAPGKWQGPLTPEG